MADPREFTLIGRFDDGITPELQKINSSISTLKQSLSGLSGKGARSTAKELGRLTSSFQTLSSSLKEQAKDFKKATEPLREYRAEVLKTARAMQRLERSGGRSFFIERENKALQEQIRLMDQLRSRRGMAPARMPREPGMGGGGGGRGPRPPRAGGRGGMDNFHMAEFAFAFQLGNALSQPITNAVVAGFQIGVGMMTKPFQYFVDGLKERIQDQQSDIKAAGGIFSISKRMKDPLVRTMDEAMEFTQQNNKRMEELAAALPGATEDYIEVGKRISDSIARITTRDEKRSIQYANQLRAERGAEMITETGRAGTKKAYTELLGKMTTQTVLAGLGTGGGGPGGLVGAYGLPGLTERMLTQDQVSMGQFQRYAAIFKDPLIMEALSRFIPKINATMGGTLDRFKIMDKFFQEVLPPEMIRKYEKSAAGIMEAFRTTLFGKEGGLFGLGRKMKGLGKTMDDFGNYIKVMDDGTRVVVQTMAEATDAELDLFNLFSDTVGNLAIVLFPIVQNLSKLWDPLRKIGTLLTDARHLTGRLLFSFESYKAGLLEMVKGMPDTQKKEFLKIGVDLRASLAAVNNLFRGLGVISKSDFATNAQKIMSDSFDVGKMIQGMIDQFMKSDLANSIGETIGKIIGTVLVEVSKVTGFISGRIEKSNKLLTGLEKGLNESGGVEAFGNIFRDVFKAIFNAIAFIVPKLPWQVLATAGIALIAPALISTFALGLSSWLGNVIKGLLTGKTAAQCISKVGASAFCGSQVTGDFGKKGGGTRGGNMFVSRRDMAYARLQQRRRVTRSQTPYAGPVGPLPAGSYASVTSGRRDPFLRPGLTTEGRRQGLSATAQGLSKALGQSAFGKSMTKVARFIPGGVVAAGAIDMGLRMASGQGIAQAAGGALFSGAGALAGAKAGAAIGTFFTPGLGTAIGGAIGTVAGGLLGEKIFSSLSGLLPASQGQSSAAKMQLDAAAKQVEAARARLGEMGVQDVGGAAMAGVTDPMKLAQTIQMLGLSTDKNVVAYQQAAEKVRALSDSAQVAKDALFKQVEFYKTELKYTPDQIWSLPHIKNLSNTYTDLQTKTSNASKQLDLTFKRMPEAASRSISIAMQKMDTKAIEYAIANQISMMDFSGMVIKPGSLQQGPGLTNLFEFPKPTNAVDPKQPVSFPGIGTTPAAGAQPKVGDTWPWYRGGFGDAVASEMKNKPPGSDLVVANSSETIIPAAGGLGMKGFIDTLSKGFSTINQQYVSIANGLNTTEANMQSGFQQVETQNQDQYNETTSRINKFQEQTGNFLTNISQNVLALTQKVELMSSMGGMFGGMGGMDLGGGYGSAGVAIAGQLGNYLKSTGGAPGSIWEHPMHGGVKGKHAPGSYHYSGRAIDIGALANEQAGVIARIKAFNAQMGVKPVEFLHAGNDPNHQDHVHVAYALGPNNGKMFTNLSAARSWEESMVPGSVKVASITGNSGEGFGGETVVNNTFHVSQQQGESGEALANRVATLFYEAMEKTNASIFG